MQFFRRLANTALSFECAQSIMRQCASMKMTYYTRCLSPGDSLTLATKFDTKLVELMLQRVGLTDAHMQQHPWLRVMFFLPLRHGGVGLTSAVNTRHAAFLASTLNSLDPLDALGVDCALLKAVAVQALQECLAHMADDNRVYELLSQAQGTPDPLQHLLKELRGDGAGFAEARGFQKRICAAMAKRDRDTMTQLLSRAQHVRLVSGQQQWVTYPFALPAGRPDLVLNDEECKLAWRLRLLLAPMEILPSRCACNQPNPFAKDPLHFFKCSALRSISAARRHQMVVQYIAAFVHRHGGTAVMEPLHIGGDKSKQRVDLRIRIGQLAADGDVHIHNPTSGNNTSLTPFAVGKPAAQRKRDKYQAHSSRDGFKFFSLGADDTGAMDPEFREFAKQLACVCANNNSVLTPGDVLREFASGVARVIHKGNFVIAKTSDLRSMEAQQPVEM